MSLDDLDIPPVTGTRGIMRGCSSRCGCCHKRKKAAKLGGKRRVRHAVRQSLNSLDDRQARRTNGTTRWDIL